MTKLNSNPIPSAKDLPNLNPAERELIGLEHVLADFAETFAQSAKRWELLIYPTVILFGIMASSGFYLIYSLTKDMHTLSRHMDPLMADNMGAMAANMATLSTDIRTMTVKIESISTNIQTMDGHIAQMDHTMVGVHDTMVGVHDTLDAMSVKLDTLSPMLNNIAQMSQAMRGMNWSTGTMSRDMSQINQNVGRPMTFINRFMPW